MFARVKLTAIALGALLGATVLGPATAQAVVGDDGIKILCDTCEVKKTHYGTMARSLTAGDIKAIRWNIRKDEHV